MIRSFELAISQASRASILPGAKEACLKCLAPHTDMVPIRDGTPYPNYPLDLLRWVLGLTGIWNASMLSLFQAFAIVRVINMCRVDYVGIYFSRRTVRGKRDGHPCNMYV